MSHTAGYYHLWDLLPQMPRPNTRVHLTAEQTPSAESGWISVPARARSKYPVKTLWTMGHLRYDSRCPDRAKVCGLEEHEAGEGEEHPAGG
jgi:hypothetical protein